MTVQKCKLCYPQTGAKRERERDRQRQTETQKEDRQKIRDRERHKKTGKQRTRASERVSCVFEKKVKIGRQAVLRKLFSLKKNHKLLFLLVNFNSQK